MADVTVTPTMQSMSFLNFASKYEFNDSLWSYSFIRCDGNWNSKATAYMDIIGVDELKAVNLFYLPQIATISTFEYLKLDKTVLDLTITELTSDLSDNLMSQIDNTAVRFRFMWLNNYEFILIFYIDCDYISDINLVLLQNDLCPNFIKSFQIRKQSITPTDIVFKFWHRFQ